MIQRAVQFQQAAQCLCAPGADARLQGRLLQFVGVFTLQKAQQLCAAGPRCIHGIQKALDKAHVADFQHIGHTGCRKALHGQLHRLCRHTVIHCADTFQAHLVDLFECAAFPAGAVHLFHIIIFFALPRRRLGIFGDSQRYIRLHGQQPAIQIGEGDHLIAAQKAPVFLIQAVLFKPAHVIFVIARLFVYGPQLQLGTLGRAKTAQIQFHKNPLSQSARCRAQSFFFPECPAAKRGAPCGRAILTIPLCFVLYFIIVSL